MSNTSGTSEQVISLPKGGGVLHGIGEKFSPDLLASKLKVYLCTTQHTAKTKGETNELQ